LVVGGRATPLVSFPLIQAPSGLAAEIALKAKALHFGASDGGVHGRHFSFLNASFENFDPLPT
jgi:hypothetical protein